MKKYQSFIITLIIIVGIIGGFILIAKPSKPGGLPVAAPAAGKSVLTSSESSYEFGSVSMAGGKVSHTFKIKNPSTVPQTITKIYTSCMCTTATLISGDSRRGPFGMRGHGTIPKINESITPQGEASVEVVFDPAAHGPAGVGPIERAVYLETTTGTLQLSFKANVIP